MAANVPLIERADIHKSCKALETIVNAFNDYCQAAEALALVQKKLARSLKDAVGLKATNELAGNALSAVANLLEALAEVDTRFVKLVDKECEGVSNDLKKWFKKLAKEERNHDEKISAANTKIKQAGLTYEKKAKKKDRDAGEEHSRYVNLLSVVGPEMSRERYNHTLLVTQRHNATLYHVASSLSRAADAEWTRACDCVRKFSPVIGRIGECRAYLEGGWLLNVPDDHDDSHGGNGNSGAIEKDGNGAVDEMGVRIAKAGSGSTETDSPVHRSSAPGYAAATSPGISTPPPSTASYQSPSYSPLAPASLPSRSPSVGPPPTAFFPASLGKLNTDSVRSIESLSSFPTPPAHFPLPAMSQLPSSPLARSTTEETGTAEGERQRYMDNSSEGTNASGNKSDQRMTASDLPKRDGSSTEQTNSSLTDESNRSRTGGQTQPSEVSASPSPSPGQPDDDDTVKIKPPEHSQAPLYRKGDDIPTANEIGVQERKVSGNIERTESVMSRNSIVASMRDKWGRGDVSSPAPLRERDIPRVPNKVADLASRYVPSANTDTVPLSPRSTGHAFPPSDRSRQVSGSDAKKDDNSTSSQASLGNTVTAPNMTLSEVDIMKRRRRLEELEDLERREQAQALRVREREIEMQAKELERERERLRALNSAAPSRSGATGVRTHPPYSYSMVNLVPVHSGTGETEPRPSSAYGEPLALSNSPSSSSSNSNPSSKPDHAPYCGCQTCSASQYGITPGHVQIVAQPRVQKERPKGWMRRLSMPVVGNAFTSSDSKKSYAVGVGTAGGPIAHLEQDSTGGISNVRPRKISLGRR